MSQRFTRVIAPLATFGLGVVCATSVGIAVAGTHGSHASAGSNGTKPLLVRAQTKVKSHDGSSQYADCPKGDVAISGGAGWSGAANTGEYIEDSGPVNHKDTFDATHSGTKPLDWYASFHNTTSEDDIAYVWVECLPS